MRSWLASLALLPLALLAPASFAQKPTDLDKLVPADALVRVEADGLDSLKKAVAEFVDAIMPGMGQTMIEENAQQMMAQPGMSELDTTKPLAFTLLSSGQMFIAASLKNPEAFEKAVKEMGDDADTRVIAGEGASLVTLGGEVKVDDLRKAGAAKAPAESGTIRGFLNVKGLYAKYHGQIEGGLAMVQMMAAQSGGTPPDFAALIKSFAADVPRVDFALSPSKSGLEIATALTQTPEAKGMLAAFAGAQTSSSPNRYLAVIPANSALALAGRTTPELMSGGLDFVTTLFGGGVDADTRARFKSLLDRAGPLIAGDIAGGLAASADGSSFATVTASNCTDKEKYRALLQEMCVKDSAMQKLMTAMLKGATLTMDFKKAAESIDGVEVDQWIFTIDAAGVTDPATKRSVEVMKKMYEEPMRIAYPAGSLVMAYGKGNSDALKAALASLKLGSTSSAAAKALPSGVAFAMSLNLVDYMKYIAAMAPPEATAVLGAFKNAPPGKDFMTIVGAPKAGAAEFKVTIPSGAIQQIVQAFQGGMGAGPK